MKDYSETMGTLPETSNPPGRKGVPGRLLEMYCNALEFLFEKVMVLTGRWMAKYEGWIIGIMSAAFLLWSIDNEDPRNLARLGGMFFVALVYAWIPKGGGRLAFFVFAVLNAISGGDVPTMDESPRVGHPYIDG